MSRSHTRALILHVEVEHYLADLTAEDAALYALDHPGETTLITARWGDEDG